MVSPSKSIILCLMNQANRDYFDQQVEWVLARLPKSVLNILGEVPLHIEDQPSNRLRQELEIDDAETLCGCFSGVPYSEGGRYGVHAYLSADVLMPTCITIFRRGIVAAARKDWGKVKRSSLREQIRITILHELAHLHGMKDDEIAAIGYG